jgi:predicted RNase H-like nuclease (RuvC/YqgF family)
MTAAADHTELKHLNRRVSQGQANLKALTEEKFSIEDKIKRERETVSRLQREIDRLKRRTEKLVVSEHAILRYVERVMGLDLEEIKKKILPSDLEEKVRIIGNGIFPCGGTHKIKVSEGVVVTILTDAD